MRIICGTNFSIHDSAAAITAGAMAARLNLPLLLVHVLDPSRYLSPSADLIEHLRRDRERKLQLAAARAGRKGGIVETAILEGSPAAKLAEVAALTRARFLVVSSIGQIGPTQWLGGNVTDRSVHLSPAPVLVLRKPGSFEPWLSGERALKVLVGYDFSAGADASLRWVKWLEEIGSCEVVIACIASAAGDRRWLDIAPPTSPLYYPSALRAYLEREIRLNCGHAFGEKPEIVVRGDWGRPDSQLIELAADIRADLIVVGASERRGLARLGSVGRAVVQYSQTSVVTVPGNWTAPERLLALDDDVASSSGSYPDDQNIRCEALELVH